MSLKLMPYVLGCVFVLSFSQVLKASNLDEEVPSGYQAPHPSLTATDITRNSEFQQKLKVLAKEQEKPKASSPQGKKRKVKKTSEIPNNAPYSKVKTSKKTSARQEHRSQAPVTTDVPSENVPLEEEDSNSRPQTMFILPDMVISPDLPSDSPSNSNAPKRHEITTLDVATVMPSTDKKSFKEKSTEKEKPTKKKAHKTPKESKKIKEPEPSSQTSSSKDRIGKNYSPAQLWDLVPPKRPQIIEETPISKAKDIIAPRELYPLHILLALAAGNRKETRPNPITGTEEQVIKHNKIYIPEIKMVVGFKIMEAGTLDLLKSMLLFDNFSQDESTKVLLDLLRIKGDNDLSRITPTVKQKAELNIKSLTQQHWYESGIHIRRVDVEKRPEGNTLGEKFRSNYGIYEFYKDGVLIKNLQIRMAFAALKD